MDGMFCRKCFKVVEQYIPSSDNLIVLWVRVRASYQDYFLSASGRRLKSLSNAGTLEGCLREVCDIS